MASYGLSADGTFRIAWPARRGGGVTGACPGSIFRGGNGGPGKVDGRVDGRADVVGFGFAGVPAGFDQEGCVVV